MLPNRKMEQFKENPDWHTTNVAAIESLVRKWFAKTYGTGNSIQTENTTPVTTILPPVSLFLALVHSPVQH